MSSCIGGTPSRKAEHIRICLEEQVTNGVRPGFEQVMIVHKALPELNYSEIDTSCEFLGKKLKAPILITGMTGGCEEAKKINRNLAAAAERCGVAFALGSQRAMIEEPKMADTYYVRDVAPTTLVVGNIGLIQFTLGYGEKQIEAAQSVGLDALALHLNPLQEMCQPEGDKQWKGCLTALKEACAASKIPIMVKETGAGVSAETARLIEQAGASAIDISGCGGTNFALVEAHRAGGETGATFHDWGIPTVCSLMEVRRAVSVPLVCSGGVKTGLDVAKAIVMGADIAGVARPLLKPATESAEAVEKALNQMITELKAAMLLSGARNPEEMKRVKYVLTGMVKDWADQRLPT
ncbi:MAG: type 2 isopentenyl-diphosphate Delta-isomerase [Candidatus Aenigmatarchaeota archaeon]